MKKSNFSESQPKAIVEKRIQGQSVEEICREHQISAATFYKWQRDLNEMANEDKRRLRELEKENARLKKMYAELMVNHAEFISQELEQWAKDREIELRFIQPGKPSQNGLVERLNGTLRKECLNLEWFESMDSLNEQIQEWPQVYNYIRPNSSIGYNTPDQCEQLNQKCYLKSVAA